MEDLILRNCTIIDGTGAEAFPGDISIQGERITGIGDLRGRAAKRVTDCGGLVAAPGFIDSHAHSDTCFLQDSSAASKLFQGITTEVSGNCGDSPFPALTEEACRQDADEWYCLSFGDFVSRFESSGYSMGTNQAMLTGHGSLRAAVVGYEDRPASPEELSAMKRLLSRDLREGAFGLSLGLEYPPGFFADARELQELGQVVRDASGIVTCHMRSEGLQIDDAIRELLSVAEASGVHVHISHLKLDHYKVHGRAPAVWEQIVQAQAAGLAVTADMYPFTASGTTLSIRCPKWSREGSPDAVVHFLQGPRRQEVIEGIRTHYFNAQRAETCLFSDDAGCWPEIRGKTLRQVAEELLHTDDYAEAAAAVLLRTNGRAWCSFFVMDEQDMLYFLCQDIGIGSDGYALPGDPAKLSYTPHPRSYSAVTTFLCLARDRGFCSLEEAVRRITAKPADTFGIPERGRLRPGLIADITVFDPKALAPRATYLQPVQLSEGVVHVLLGGRFALEAGKQTDLRLGRFLRKA